MLQVALYLIINKDKKLGAIVAKLFILLFPIIFFGFKAQSGPESSKYITCAPGSICPSWIARVLIQENSTIYACAGTLIKPDLLSTDAHCLPQDMRKVGLSCLGKGRFYFPASGSLPEQVGECDHIEQIRESTSLVKDPNTEDDFVTIKLKTPMDKRRLPVELSAEGLYDRQKVTIVKVEQPPKLDAVASVLSQECEVRFNTVAVPSFSNPGYAKGAIISCPLRPGNSGSAVLVDGKMRALVTDVEIKNDDQPVDEPQKINLELAKFGFAYVLNLACVNGEPSWPNMSKAVPCQKETRTPREVLVWEKVKQLVSQKISSARIDLKSEALVGFRWRAAMGIGERNQIITLAYPVCSDDLDQLKLNVWSDDFTGVGFIFKVNVDPSSYDIQLSDGVDSLAQVKIPMRIKSRLNQNILAADFQLSLPEDLKKFGFPMEGTIASCTMSQP